MDAFQLHGSDGFSAFLRTLLKFIFDPKKEMFSPPRLTSLSATSRLSLFPFLFKTFAYIFWGPIVTPEVVLSIWLVPGRVPLETKRCTVYALSSTFRLSFWTASESVFGHAIANLATGILGRSLENLSHAAKLRGDIPFVWMAEVAVCQKEKFGQSGCFGTAKKTATCKGEIARGSALPVLRLSHLPSTATKTQMSEVQRTDLCSHGRKRTQDPDG